MKKTAVVSLINEHERRQHIDSLFNKHHLDFSYFDAIDKSRVDDILNKHELTVHSERMSKGEIACYLSHYCLWQQVVDQELPYLMVFEDDIYFSKNATELLTNLDWLPNDFDVIKLETMYQKVMINKGLHLMNDLKLCRMKSQHYGTAGYIVSYRGAKNMIDRVQQQGILCPVDHLMFDKLLKTNSFKALQLNPAICIQDKIYNLESFKFGSELEQGRSPRPLVKQKLSGAQKLNRELNRLWRQLKVVEKISNVLLIAKGYKAEKIEYQE